MILCILLAFSGVNSNESLPDSRFLRTMLTHLCLVLILDNFKERDATPYRYIRNHSFSKVNRLYLHPHGMSTASTHQTLVYVHLSG